MSDRKQVNVNEAALDWLREHDQPINDAPQPAATECPQCGGEKNNPCFLWTQTTGWGDVECGPKCDHSFHAKDTPIAPAILARSQPTVTREQLVKSLREMCNAAGWVLQGASMALGSLEDARIEALALLRAAEGRQ